jgi:polyvinyl alcohol dehydrogenase (cytochrome)
MKTKTVAKAPAGCGKTSLESPSRPPESGGQRGPIGSREGRFPWQALWGFAFGTPSRALLLILSFTMTFASAFAQAPAANAGMCATQTPMSNPAAGQHWNGWGNGPTNTRFQAADQAGLTAAQIPSLKLKWAFGLEGATSSRSQVAVAGGRLFVGAETGMVYALDAKTGCTYWTFKAPNPVRTAISVGPRQPSGYAIYFVDLTATAYALDAATGQQIWARKVEDNPGAKGTGSATLHEGVLYVPVSGVNEENTASRPASECCTFRGSVSALNAQTGAVIWKSYTIEETPQPRGKSTTGAQLWGPAGAGIWSAPTIDARRGLVYVGTGNGYADPPTKTSDAVVAMDIKTGKIKWASQVLPNDVFVVGCNNPANPNCPKASGPDHDFSASPMIATLPGGRELLVIPQKSGIAWALDPDKEGAVVWKYQAGRGSAVGGVWGGSVDQQNAYFGVSDYLTPAPGGLHAVSLATGERVWYTPPSNPRLCGTVANCSAAQSAALTTMPGVVFSGSADGGIRAYSTKDGSVIWLYDTNKSFETVNGVQAKGGSMDAAGPTISGGMVYVPSGVGGLVGRPGNVLLAFGVE